MEFNTNEDFICRLPDGRFQLEVKLVTINGRLVDFGTNLGSHPLYFDRVTVGGREIEPTSIEYGYYTYEYKVDNDAIIGVWYHTEN